MLNVQRFVVNMIEVNCYVLWDDSREAVIIDCGAFYEEDNKIIYNFIEEKQLIVQHLLCTHGHFDHVFGNQFVFDTYGLQPRISSADIKLYLHADEQVKLFLHRDIAISLPPPEALEEGKPIVFGHHNLFLIPTPGHTPGGICFYEESEAVLFSGDSLFRRSIGRCDLPGGDEAMLIDSLQRNILTLPEHVTVLPGHGEPTTIGEERRNNPYLL